MVIALDVSCDLEYSLGTGKLLTCFDVRCYYRIVQVCDFYLLLRYATPHDFKTSREDENDYYCESDAPLSSDIAC